ncbi:MAG: hypothetical protein K5924_02730 [Chloroflexi bacterium]|nr:hypothetical protein [Chloroflexota bacterium]
MRLHRLIRATAVALALTGLLAGQTLAAKPDVVEKHRAFTRSFEVADCGAFTLTGTFDIVRTVTHRYDRDGNLVRTTYLIRYDGLVYNTADPSKAVRDDGHRTVIDDHVRGVTRDGGGAHHVTLPGEGLVFGQAGMIVWHWNGTPDDSDDYPFKFAGHTDEHWALCDYLG